MCYKKDWSKRPKSSFCYQCYNSCVNECCKKIFLAYVQISSVTVWYLNNYVVIIYINAK